jgi:hypothetical protein
MKQIELKRISEGEQSLDYKDALTNILGHAPLGDGFTLECAGRRHRGAKLRISRASIARTVPPLADLPHPPGHL